jgi:hypothetical protein
MLCLLSAGDWDKDAEVLALRHRITVLERQLGGTGRGLGRGIGRSRRRCRTGFFRDVLRRLRLLVRPGTVLRWPRDLAARRHADRSRPKRSGRPRTVHSIRALVVLITSVVDSRRA